MNNNSGAEDIDIIHLTKSVRCLNANKKIKKTSVSKNILFLLEKRPHTSSELISIMNIGKRRFYPEITRLRQKKKLKNLEGNEFKSFKENYPDANIRNTDKKAYALIYYKPEKDIIKRILLEKRKEFFNLRWLDIKELSRIIGKLPKETEKDVYEISPNIGWKPPTEEDIEYTKIVLKIVNKYLINKKFINNVELKNGELLSSDIEIIIKLTGAEYDTSANIIRYPFADGTLIHAGDIKKITREEWEQWIMKIIWGDVRYMINKYLPSKKDKIQFSDWLIEKTHTDIKDLKINADSEIIDTLYFRTIAEMALKLARDVKEL